MSTRVDVHASCIVVNSGIITDVDTLSEHLLTSGELPRLQKATVGVRRLYVVQYLLQFYNTYNERLDQLSAQLSESQIDVIIKTEASDNDDTDEYARSQAVDEYGSDGADGAESEPEDDLSAPVSFAQGGKRSPGKGRGKRTTSDTTPAPDAKKPRRSAPRQLRSSSTELRDFENMASAVVVCDRLEEKYTHIRDSKTLTVKQVAGEILKQEHTEKEQEENDPDWFPDESALSNHACKGEKKVKRAYDCQICGEKFCVLSRLQKHLKTSHPGCIVKLPGKKHRPPSEKASSDWPDCPAADPPGFPCDDTLPTDTTPQRPVSRELALAVVCGVCGKKFKFKSSYVRHLRTAHQDKSTQKYRCEKCDARYDLADQLEEHTSQCVATAPAPAQYACPMCESVFHSSTSLKEHDRIVHRQQMYECSVCSQEYKWRAELRTHALKAHPGQRHQNKNKLRFDVHMKIEGGVYTCNHCGKQYREKRTLKDHLKIVHSLGDDFVCVHCGETFKNPKTFKNHVRAVHQGVRYACTLGRCGKQFKSRESAYKHQQFVKHEVDAVQDRDKTISVVYTCVKCGVSYDEMTRLEDHRKQGCSGEVDTISTDPEGLCCTQCSVTLQSKEKLKEHNRLVHEVKTYECKFCSQAFRSQASQYEHTRLIHRGLYYACWLCDAKFKWRVGLRKHLVTVHPGHSTVPESKARYNAYITPENGQFRCNHCDKLFKHKGGLKEHLSVELGSGENHVCMHCGQTFKHRNTYTKHIATIHQGVRYACGLPGCGSLSTSKPIIKRHQRRVHGLVYDKNAEHQTIRTVYRCSLCGECYEDVTALDQHKATCTEADSDTQDDRSELDGTDLEKTAAPNLTDEYRGTPDGLTLADKQDITEDDGLPGERSLKSPSLSDHNRESRLSTPEPPETEDSIECCLPESLETPSLDTSTLTGVPPDTEYTATKRKPPSDHRKSPDHSRQKEGDRQGNMAVIKTNHDDDDDDDDDETEVEDNDRDDDSEENDEEVSPKHETEAMTFLAESAPGGVGCDRCGGRYTDTAALREHMHECVKQELQDTDHKTTSQGSEKPKQDGGGVYCNDCGDWFRSEMAMWEHDRVVHKEHFYGCPHCGTKFKWRQSLKQHLRKYHPGQPVSTPRKPRERRKQREGGIIKGEFTCMICEEKFPSNDRLHQHLSSQHKVGLNCTFCNLTFKHRSTYLYHVRSKHQGVRYHCNMPGCNKEYKSVKMLRIHQNMSHSVAPVGWAGVSRGEDGPEAEATGPPGFTVTFSCDRCKAQFWDREALEGHCQGCTVEREEKHNADSSEEVACKICEAKFKSESSMWEHNRIVHKQQLYGCGLCKDKFKWRQSLRQHMQKVHPGQAPIDENKMRFELHMNSDSGVFCCNYCAKEYKQKQHLKEHLRTAHDLGDDFVCIHCGETFKHRNTFTIHVTSVHQGIRYKCCIGDCEKDYKSKHAVKQHQQVIHHPRGESMGEEQRPSFREVYMCTKCGVRYPAMSALDAHKPGCGGKLDLDAQDQIDWFPCNHCGMRFKTENKVWEHTRLIHKGVMYLCKFCTESFKWRAALKAHIDKVHRNQVPHRTTLQNTGTSDIIDKTTSDIIDTAISNITEQRAPEPVTSQNNVHQNQ